MPEEKRSGILYSKLEEDISKNFQPFLKELGIELTPEEIKNYSSEAVQKIRSNTNSSVYSGLVIFGARSALRRAVEDHNLKLKK